MSVITFIVMIAQFHQVSALAIGCRCQLQWASHRFKLDLHETPRPFDATMKKPPVR
jgi:hypothetical protein